MISGLLAEKAATPDVYVIDGIWPGTLEAHLLDLRPFLNEYDRRHIKALLDNDTIDSRIVSLPFYMNVGLLYYRPDLLSAYGYKAPPASWTELAEMALRIQQGERNRGKKTFWGYIWQGGAYEGLTCNALEWQASFGGGHIIEGDGTISVSNRGTAEAFETAASWIGRISPPSVLSYTESDTFNVFRTGNAAFMRYWSSGFLSLQRSMSSGTVAVALLPAGPAGRAQTVGGFQIAVSRYSAHTREAAEFASYLTGPEVQLRRAVRRGYLPTFPHLYDNPAVLQALPQIAVLHGMSQQMSVVRPSSVTRGKYAEISKAYYETVHNVLSRKVETKTALADLDQRLAALTAAAPGRRP